MEQDNIQTLVNALYKGRSRAWDAALVTTQTFLETLADELLDNVDRDRMNAKNARIKSPQRAADKVRRKIAEAQIAVPTTSEAIADALGDLVGIKVLCKSPRDQLAISKALEASCRSPECSMRFAEEPLDYVSNPKDSGYRAYHAVLLVRVPTHQGDLDVKVEVQIKTRLQDAWGELTHEDMYKPGEALKPNEFHNNYAKQMAGLLAQVDEMADSLAEELDQQTSPLKPSERGSDAVSNGIRNLPATISARVTKTGPKYALAVGPDGRRGLIRARSLRDTLGETKLIDVDEYLSVGDEVSVRVEETDAALYYDPIKIG
ncbi:RelA/SpoT protein [Rhodococcus sp. WS3]|uniref:RelA/SpoT protein n=1 Tax=Rhodococcus sp. WS3 TaxID=2486271 RepID=UPI001142B2A3|nr:RelA/SpoT protein [Rhodococcus sp. WS3]ROZ44746.1 RelA/SpoT protein [Rhodococcus sp. WS3]